MVKLQEKRSIFFVAKKKQATFAGIQSTSKFEPKRP